jgi:hypothetical protein
MVRGLILKIETIPLITELPKKMTTVSVHLYSPYCNAPLIITSVQTTSNCTILSKQNDTILPGKTSKIDVKYNMAEGPIRKTLP